MTKVSIITPSYNQGQFLEETIQSVLNQEHKNIEYIIIDGGSTDNSVDVIKKYESSIDYWVSEKDDGQADAINKGLKKASGDLVCWVNSDDILYPNFVSRMVALFEDPSLDFIYGDVEQGETYDNKKVRKGRAISFSKMLKTYEVPVPQQASMWRKSLMDRIGYLDPKWNVLLDREFFMRIFRNAKTLYVPEVFGFFRNHEDSKSVALAEKWTHELPKLHDEIFKDNIYKLNPAQLKAAKANKVNTSLISARVAESMDQPELRNKFLSEARSTSRGLFIRYYHLRKWEIRFKKLVSIFS